MPRAALMYPVSPRMHCVRAVLEGFVMVVVVVALAATSESCKIEVGEIRGGMEEDEEEEAVVVATARQVRKCIINIRTPFSQHIR